MANGDPLWVLLAVNDHFSTENPIRRAFAERARVHLPKVAHKATDDLKVQALAGRPLSTLSQAERRTLRHAYIEQRKSVRTSHDRWEPTPKAFQRSQSRRSPSRARRTLALRSVAIARTNFAAR